MWRKVGDLGGYVIKDKSLSPTLLFYGSSSIKKHVHEKTNGLPPAETRKLCCTYAFGEMTKFATSPDNCYLLPFFQQRIKSHTTL
ncbi:hypothetical protein NPIL_452131 [Nephila pilipes]|uniref:Uncharacterized protein n=1 Tax=Nephila pilipes TaxID=299642 RepID=A0A8X6QQD1_NEPPI|nr:hypothetical protein NPIL_452131 [Nephila pilipes]